MSALSINKENFQKEVMESEQVVLLDFFAEWCGPCRMLSPILDEIAQENQEIKVGKVNIDEQLDLAEEFGVMSVPTLVVMKAGRIVSRSLGVRPKQQILAMLG